jgi:hypothetical protein
VTRYKPSGLHFHDTIVEVLGRSRCGDEQVPTPCAVNVAYVAMISIKSDRPRIDPVSMKRKNCLKRKIM